MSKQKSFCYDPYCDMHTTPETNATLTEIGKAGLQAQIAKLLDALGIVYIRSRSDKRTTNAPGTPDFILCVRRSPACCPTAMAWECKLPKGKLRPDQEKMRERMTRSPNAWRYRVITSVAEAEQELRDMGLIS